MRSDSTIEEEIAAIDADPLRLDQLPAEPAPFRSAVDVAKARARATVDPYAIPAEAVPALPMLEWSGIIGRTPADRIPVALGVPHRRPPRSFLDPRTIALREEAAHGGWCDAIGRACGMLGANPDGRPWCEAPRGDAFERGDGPTWQALAVLAARGMRALVVKVDGAGEATARRVAVRPHDEAVAHALAMVFGVASRGWKGKRGRPATYDALVAMLRAIVRRQIGPMLRVRSNYATQAAAQAALDAMAARDDAAREQAAADAGRAYASALAGMRKRERERTERRADKWSRTAGRNGNGRSRSRAFQGKMPGQDSPQDSSLALPIGDAPAL